VTEIEVIVRTLWVRTADVLAAYVLLPLYTAVIELDPAGSVTVE
jgi:hypothetical protein